MIDIPQISLPRAASDFRLEAPNADETQRPDQAESGAKSDSDHHDDEEEDSPEVYVHHLHPMSQEDPPPVSSEKETATPSKTKLEIEGWWLQWR